MPGLTVIRPADANETVAAWKYAIEASGPVALVLTRQNVPTVVTADAVDVARGAYVAGGRRNGAPDVLLLATGSEVAIALGACDLLATEGIAATVVSMPSWELFTLQPPEYRESVLPAAVRARVSVEAAATLGWERYTGDAGEMVGLDHFGASAPYQKLYEAFGITATAVAEAARRSIAKAAAG
jgi:transketolase